MHPPTQSQLDAAITRWLREPDWAAFTQAYDRPIVLYEERNARPKTLTLDSATLDRLMFCRWLYQTGRVTP